MKKWTVRKRIVSGYGALIVLLLAIIGVSIRSVFQLESLLNTSQDVNAQNQFMLQRLADHLTWVRGLDLHLLGGQKFSGQLDYRKCALGQWLYHKEAQEQIRDAEIKRLLKEIEEPHVALHASGIEVVEHTANHRQERAHGVFLSQTLPTLEKLQGIFSRVRARYDTVTAENAKAVRSETARTRITLLAAGGAAALAAVILALLLSNGLVRLLGKAATELKQGAEQVASAAAQVSSASQSLSQGASEQAASLQETSASSEEITSMTRKTAENSRSASELMSEAERAVSQANRKLEQMLQSMGEINSSSEKIAQIIRVIDEIAFQTNILALNASVEAARAGQAGMGFAVVADEVRNLAQRSADAAKDTATLIEESIARATEGSGRLDDVAGAVAAITAIAARVKTLVDEVNLGSQEQARGMQQIATAINQMEQVTQRTAATAEESASASEQLSAQAATLNDIAAELNRMIGGAGTRSR